MVVAVAVVVGVGVVVVVVAVVVAVAVAVVGVGMKSKILILCLLLAPAMGWAASTSTCPSVENGIWTCSDSGLIEPMGTQEYKIEFTTWDANTYFRMVADSSGTIRLEGEQAFCHLWRVIPYKIEWHCVEWEGNDGRVLTPRGWEYVYKACIREEGYREDGIVVWRKPS